MIDNTADNVVPLVRSDSTHVNLAHDDGLSKNSAPAESLDSRHDVSIRLLSAPAQYVRDNFSENSLRELAQNSGMSPEQLEGRNNWITWNNFSQFLEGVFELLNRDEETFKRACVHNHKETFGPLRFVAQADSPRMLYEFVTRMSPMFFSFGKMEIVGKSLGGLTLRFASDKPDTRLMCLSRQAIGAALPTLWRLPPATLKETSCICRGDSHCTYQVRWIRKRIYLPMLLGALAGGATAAMIAPVGIATIPLWALLTFVGSSIGTAYASSKRKRRTLDIAREMNDAFIKSTRRQEKDSKELRALKGLGHDWTKLVEEHATERTAHLEDVFAHFAKQQESQRTTVRNYTEDVSHPLAAIRKSSSFLRANLDEADLGTITAIDNLETALERTEQLLCELQDTNESTGSISKYIPKLVTTSEMSAMLRRRLRTLTYGRHIRTSVFRTREAPEAVTIDMQIFDQIVSNLLTNASKYTHEGSIVLELDGQSDSLILKLSDTGLGIPKDKIESIFEPKEWDATSRDISLGLSVVVQLLARIGGSLEVMSTAKNGTTFWVFLPIEPNEEVITIESAGVLATPGRFNELVEKVVRIRPVEEA